MNWAISRFQWTLHHGISYSNEDEKFRTCGADTVASLFSLQYFGTDDIVILFHPHLTSLH